MSKKVNISNRCFLATVCVASGLVTAIPVSAVEMVDSAVVAQIDNSIIVAGECDCVQDWQLMSKQYGWLDGNTHTVSSMYYSECIHGLKRKDEITRENHGYGNWKSLGHLSGSRKHDWHGECVCGDGKSITISCYADVNGGMHAYP